MIKMNGSDHQLGYDFIQGELEDDFVCKVISFVYVITPNGYQTYPNYSAVFTCFDKNMNSKVYVLNDKESDQCHGVFERYDKNILDDFLETHLFEDDLIVQSQRVGFKKTYQIYQDEEQYGGRWVLVNKRVGTNAFSLKRDHE